MNNPADRMRAIRERIAKATPGPWEIDGDGRDICTFDRGVAPFEITDGGSFARNKAEHDAALIVNAPADLEYLLKRCERLEAALSASKLIHDHACSLVSPRAGKMCSLGVFHVGLDPQCDCIAGSHNAAIDAALNGDA